MDRGGRRREVLVAAAGDRERVLVDLEPVGVPGRGGELAGDGGRPVGRAVVDQDHALDRAAAAGGASGGGSVPRRGRARTAVNPGAGSPSAQPQRTLKSVAPSRLVIVGERACPTWRVLAVSSAVLRRLRAPDAALRDAVQVARAARGRRSRSARPGAAARPPPPTPRGRPGGRGRARAARTRRRRSRPRGARSAPRAPARRRRPAAAAAATRSRGDRRRPRSGRALPAARACRRAARPGRRGRAGAA